MSLKLRYTFESHESGNEQLLQKIFTLEQLETGILPGLMERFGLTKIGRNYMTKAVDAGGEPLYLGDYIEYIAPGQGASCNKVGRIGELRGVLTVTDDDSWTVFDLYCIQQFKKIAAPPDNGAFFECAGTIRYRYRSSGRPQVRYFRIEEIENGAPAAAAARHNLKVIGRDRGTSVLDMDGIPLFEEDYVLFAGQVWKVMTLPAGFVLAPTRLTDGSGIYEDSAKAIPFSQATGELRFLKAKDAEIELRKLALR